MSSTKSSDRKVAQSLPTSHAPKTRKSQNVAQLATDTLLRFADYQERYTIQGVIGKGEHGVVLHGTCRRTDTAIAIKVEYIGRKTVFQLLILEHSVLSKLQDCEYVPKILHFYRDIPVASQGGTLNVLVMQKYGRSLRDVLRHKDFKHPAPPKTFRAIAECGILAMKRLHDLGLIYKDFNDANFVFESDTHARLIDMGLVQQHESAEAHRARGIRNGGVEGTMKFASIHNHEYEHQSYRDDIESFGYILWMMLEPLPWEDTGKERDIHHLKTEHSPPKPLEDYFAAIKTLDFGERPESYESLLNKIVEESAPWRECER